MADKVRPTMLASGCTVLHTKNVQMGNFTDIDDQLAQAKRKIARSAKTKADLEARRDEALARLEVPRETLQAESQKLSQQKVPRNYS